MQNWNTNCMKNLGARINLTVSSCLAAEQHIVCALLAASQKAVYIHQQTHFSNSPPSQHVNGLSTSLRRGSEPVPQELTGIINVQSSTLRLSNHTPTKQKINLSLKKNSIENTKIEKQIKVERLIQPEKSIQFEKGQSKVNTTNNNREKSRALLRELSGIEKGSNKGSNLNKLLHSLEEDQA